MTRKTNFRRAHNPDNEWDRFALPRPRMDSAWVPWPVAFAFALTLTMTISSTATAIDVPVVRSSSTSADLIASEFRRRRNFELSITWEARARTAAADARAALEQLELCEQRTAPVFVESPSSEPDAGWVLGVSVVAFAVGVVLGGLAL